MELRREGGVSLETLQWTRASAPVEGEVCWFLSSYDGDLSEPLVGPQGGPVSTRVGRGPPGFLCSGFQCQGPHLDLRQGMSGNFLSCLKGVKDPFCAQEGRWDFFQDSIAEKGLSLR